MVQTSFLQPHTYEWPPVGSINHLRSWTFEIGTAIFDAQRRKYGRGSDAPPLSPKSKLVQILLEEPPASPTTILERRPMYDKDAMMPPPSYAQARPENSAHNKLYAHDERLDLSASSKAPTSEQCYSCGIVCYDVRVPQLERTAGESSHWFVDVHNGLKRKVAYIFCSTCISVLMGRLDNPHLGCGHLPSPVSLDYRPSQECMPMFCGKCRGDIGRGLGVYH